MFNVFLIIVVYEYGKFLHTYLHKVISSCLYMTFNGFYVSVSVKISVKCHKITVQA